MVSLIICLSFISLSSIVKPVKLMASQFPISDRLARLGRSDNRSRQMFLFIEAYRIANMGEERSMRRSASRARVRI